MFSRLGAFTTRFRWLIIVVWVVAAALLTWLAPDINKVAVSDQRAFLPSSAPSLDASKVVAQYFPDSVPASSAVLVVDAGAGLTVEEGQAATFISELTAWLTGPTAPEAVEQVLSPTAADELTKASLVSPDQQVALLLVRFRAMGTEPITQQAMTAIKERLANAPAEINAYMTGDGPILGAYSTSTQGSVDSTTWITILLVIVILLVIYRSPISPLIPLASITIAYLISRGIIGILGAHALTISMYTNVFLIVVLFGAGTDYCLFLISRFREEMADTDKPFTATRRTVRAVGETIASSAGTVIVGLATMTATELGLYNTSGPSLAIGVAITLAAGLTLTPALLSILGNLSFWPRKASHLREAGIWHSWAGKVVRHPVVALLVPVLILIPLALYGQGLSRDFDLLGDLSPDNEARVGFDIIADHMGPGTMLPLTILVTDPAAYTRPEGLQKVDELAATLAKLDHVSAVRSFTALLPDPGILSVAAQLQTQIDSLQRGEAQLRAYAAALPTSPSAATSNVDAVSQELENAVASLVDLYGYLLQLKQAYPEVTQNEGFEQATGALVTLAQIAQKNGLALGSAGPLGALVFPGSSTSSDSSPETSPSTKTVDLATVVPQIVTQLKVLATGLESLRSDFANRPEAVLLPNLYLKNNEGLKALRDSYFSADGTAARLEVVLDTGPYTTEALDTAQKIRETLQYGGYNGVVEGNSAVLLDLREASNRDMNRALVFVLSGVFVVLLLLLRALVAPIYLILTILLSYAATLGVVRLVFVDLLGAAGITWWVPMFMFVMLVALGMDYNIFLIGRVKEEVAAHGTRPGTRLALARTGGIITSAGIVMAGTFASMMSASILGLLQIGFAVAFGILLDTFVVRTTLVPAIVVLLDRWSWWPRRGPGRPVDSQTSSSAPHDQSPKIDE